MFVACLKIPPLADLRIGLGRDDRMIYSPEQQFRISCFGGQIKSL